MTARGVWIGKCGVQIGEALGGSSGEVERPAGRVLVAERGREAESSQGGEAAVRCAPVSRRMRATMRRCCGAGATAGGLIRRAISPCLSAGDECGRAGEKQLLAGAAPCDGLRAAGSDDGERRDAAAQKPCAAVAEAELPVPEEVVGPTPRSKMRISISRSLKDAHELHVGLVRKVGMGADFCADGLPCLAGDGEGRIVDGMTK